MVKDIHDGQVQRAAEIALSVVQFHVGNIDIVLGAVVCVEAGGEDRLVPIGETFDNKGVEVDAGGIFLVFYMDYPVTVIAADYAVVLIDGVILYSCAYGRGRHIVVYLGIGN